MTRPRLTFRSYPPSRSQRHAVALALAAAVLAGAPPAAAETAVRVADINPGPTTGGTDNLDTYTRFVKLGDRVLFGVDDGIHGNELWATDGTAAGTRLVADVCPGACSSLPGELVVAGDRVYFAGDDGAHGRELWVTDGTAAGTRLVADLEPGLGGSRPREMAAFGSGVGFSARLTDGAGTEPWFSDGTAAGTIRLGDLRPGPDDPGAVFWDELGGELVFSADDGIHGIELWATDGTPLGTHLLVDVLPGSEAGVLGGSHENAMPIFVRLGERLLFVGHDGSETLVLWVTDGTPGGTEVIRPMRTSIPYGLGVLGDRAYFGVVDPIDQSTETSALWSTDGTPAGTEEVAEIATGGFANPPRDLRAAGGRLFFVGNDGVHGNEVWVTDGTTAGTSMVVDLNPGPASSTFFAYAAFQPLAGGVVFFGDDGVHGAEPWFTDGTAAGTVALGDLYPGPRPSFEVFLPYAFDRPVPVGGRALFRAWSPDSGVELWASDGTPGGTARIEIDDQASSLWIQQPYFLNTLWGPRAIGAFRDGVLLRADDGVSGEEPWISDGTAEGTRRVADLLPGVNGSSPWGFLEASGGAVFAGPVSDCCTLWRTDGTEIEPLAPEGSEYRGEMLSAVQLDDLIVLEIDGEGLAASDGTAEGTRVLGASSNGYPVLADGRWVYFGDAEPSRTDGWTVEQLADVRPGPDSSVPYPLAGAGPAVLFAADDGVHGMEAWGVDRSGAGAVLLADASPGSGDGVARVPDYPVLGKRSGAAAGGRGFFLAGDAATGEELWSSDGTPGGTAPLRDVFPGPRSSEIRWLTAAGDRVFFVADDGVHGREPWTSDGTLVGTRLLADLVPGPGSSLPAELTAVGDRIYFAAHTPAHGRELWVADGTAGGTRRLTDLAPGPLPASPMALTVSGGWLWFVATDGLTGFELYRLGLPGTIFADGFESGDTTAWSASR